jgi:hypothetical protein
MPVFKHHARWQVASAETSHGRIRPLERIRPSTWWPTSKAGCTCSLNTTVASRDIVDYSPCKLDQPPDKMLHKLAHKELKLGRENRFRFAGGIWADRERLIILSSPRNLAPETWIGIAR